MLTRRDFLQMLGVFGAGQSFLNQAVFAAAPNTAQSSWRMPDESEPHNRTWMAFGAREEIWGAHLLPEVQRNLATIALTIAEYEPVSMLVRPAEMALARALMGDAVELIPAELDDLWMRDMGPVFVVDAKGHKAAIDFNFNGWGNKQPHQQDAKVAALVAQRFNLPILSTSLVLEGGGIEVDGQGSAIITESCVLNDNRNPGVSKADCEAVLKSLLGLEKIIWLPGIRGRDITDGHTDFYARFASPGVVLAAYDPDPDSFDHAVTQQHLDILRSTSDAQGRALEVVVLETPSSVRPAYDNREFSAGYINFYVCNGAVIMPEFGDLAADQQAKQALQRVFPEHDVIAINIDGIAAGGGGIHCTTQQEPLG